MDIDTLINHLRSLHDACKYVLLNSIMHEPSGYLDQRTLTVIADKLSRLHHLDVVDGIVYADAYFLQALSDIACELACELEASPNDNCTLN